MAQPIPIDLAPVPGYRYTECLHAGDTTVVYRAVAEHNPQESVVIKLLYASSPSFSELVKFRNQYTIIEDLSIPGIVAPLSLEPWCDSYALVMEDSGGISLDRYVRDRELSWQDVVAIALQLTDILKDLGQHRIIHKDIKPANLLIHLETKQVRLIDFGIASLLPRENQSIQSPSDLEGTLAYLAPEQTGRMNRGVDYRVDIYSLGVTLYELLTGQLPFQTADPMELIHSHLAKAPTPPFDLPVSLPLPLSNIVLKLMAKNAEERYQSLLGLQHDLQQCLDQWELTGRIEPFELGQRDLCDRFMIPEKLYGRETEVQVLLDAFERVSQGSSELILVAGFSGIGKTTVINEVHKPIVKQRGYFIQGKFEQFNRNIPFSAFSQAFEGLVKQLLGESDAELTAWKSQLLASLGESAQVLIDLLPSLEVILGPQPATPDLSGIAAQNRLNLLLQKFIQVFAKEEHPLVIFVDDLQWADSASLNLLKLLMTEVDSKHLLLLGAYRDNEVYPAHPLILTLAEIEKTQAQLNTLTLSSLSIDSLNALVSDTLHVASFIAQPLTELVMQKTQGNPFFASQFLKFLHQNQLITFDVEGGYWQCDLGKVRKAALTDDVVQLMVSQLQQLPPQTVETLKLAACLGAQFDLETLAIITEQSTEKTATDLWTALQKGFVLPTSQIYKFFQAADTVQLRTTVNPTYRFLHDRVQQAAYALIAENHQATTHWHVGHLLWQYWADNLEDRIFDLVNQLNLGRSQSIHVSQNWALADLNLQAAQKAKLSAAYQAAQTYCQTGMSLLSPETWTTDYELMYSLHYHGAESAYLNSDFEQAENLYQEALSQSRSPLDQASIYRLQMTQYQLQGRNAEAIDIQRKSTQLLGWTIPTEPEQIQLELDQSISTVDEFLEKQTVESISDLPKMVDANTDEILRILQILFYAAWLDGQPTLALLSLAKMTTLSLQYGNSEMSPFGYVGFGLISNVILKNVPQSYQFGRMAVELCEQFSNADVRGMTNFLFAADVHSWKRPLREADQFYENAYKFSMDAGNWLTVSFMMMQSGSDRLTYGKNLEALYTTTQAHISFLRKIKSLENLDALTVGVLQPVRQLLGLTPSLTSFDDDDFSELNYLQKYQQTPYHLAWFYSVKIRHAYLFNQVDSYIDLIPNVDIIESTIPTHAKLPSTIFYVALMHLALIGQGSGNDELHWQAIKPLEEKLEQWRQDCPENIAHKCWLIQAEKAKLKQDIATAIECFEQSISQAQAQGYIYESALANERAAIFYLDWGKEKVAAGYLQDAYYHYAHWGAKAKIDDLQHRYPSLLHSILQSSPKAVDPLVTLQTLVSPNASSVSSLRFTSNSVGELNQTLDMAEIIRASQTLTEKLGLGELLQELSQMMLQTSGGDTCAIVLPNDGGGLEIRATATPERIHLGSDPLDDSSGLPVQLIQYVKNTQEMVVLDHSNDDLPWVNTYFHSHQFWSVLCLPMLYQGELIGILYLQNQAIAGVFHPERITVLNFLSAQAAIAISHAHMYDSLALQSSVVETSTEGMAILEDGKYIYLNASHLALLGYEKHELIGESWHILYDSEQLKRFSQVIFPLLERQGTWSGETIAKRKDGSTFPQEVSLCAIDEKKLICVCRDISDRKQAEENSRLLASVVESSDDAIITKTLDGTITSWNQAAVNLFGYTQAEALGQPILMLFPPDRYEEENYIIAQLKNKQRIEHFETIRLHKEGDPIDISVTISPLTNDQGNVVGASKIVRDIRDRKVAEQTLKRINEQLEQRVAERTAELESMNLALADAKLKADNANHAKSEFLANMSHELRTPLNGILGYAQILQRSKSLSQKEANSVQTIHRCGKHLLTLINDVLDISKIEARKLELETSVANLTTVFQSVVEICKIRADQKNIQFVDQTQSDSLPPLVQVDEKRLRQVLINLLGNAIKFTEQGFVCLELSVIASTGDEVSLHFSVKDSGIGIKPEDLEKLFQAFEQVGDRKRHEDGTGLGLAISQCIVQMMGGEIQVQSQLGQGSEFFFDIVLPVIQPEGPFKEEHHGSQTLPHAPRPIVGYEGEPRSILVVDDRAENRDVLSNLLQPLGFQVLEAENGQEGMSLWRMEHPDLVIADVVMPVMDGFEMIQHILEERESQPTKIIVSSASVAECDRTKSLEMGANAFLPKPIDVEALLQQVQTQLALEWCYERGGDEAAHGVTQTHAEYSESSGELEIPSVDELQTLLRFSQAGRLRKLRLYLESMIEQDRRYLEFAERLFLLEKQFKVNEIEQFLQRYLSANKETSDPDVIHKL